MPAGSSEENRRAQANTRPARTRVLEAHPEEPCGPEFPELQQPRPRLLRREDRKCQAISPVVEGPAGVQQETRGLLVKRMNLRRKIGLDVIYLGERWRLDCRESVRLFKKNIPTLLRIYFFGFFSTPVFFISIWVGQTERDGEVECDFLGSNLALASSQGPKLVYSFVVYIDFLSFLSLSHVKKAR